MRQGLDSLNERNRNDEPFTAADVQPYIDYFDRHGEPNDRLLAYYLLGRAYHEQGEAPMALEQYHKAIEFADTLSHDCDFGQLSRVYSQMGDLCYKLLLSAKS
jgi:tetratricopeptide (TPR) repeat protein